MVVAKADAVGDDWEMPGMAKRHLTKTQAKRLAAASARVKRAEGDLDDARRAWADLVRELGASAVAREIDLTPQAVSARLRVIEQRSGRWYQ